MKINIDKANPFSPPPSGVGVTNNAQTPLGTFIYSDGVFQLVGGAVEVRTETWSEFIWKVSAL